MRSPAVPSRAFALGGILLACLAVVPACEFAIDIDDPVPPPRTCISDSDCVSARREVCRLPDGSGSPLALNSAGSNAEARTGGGICIVPGTPTEREVWLEIRPDRSTALPQTQYGPVNLGSGQNQELVLPKPAMVTGRVEDGATQQAVPGARVRFRTSPLIPGRPLTFDFESDTKRETEGRLTGRLLPAADYSVLISPPDVGDTRTPPELPVETSLAGPLDEELVFVVSNANELIRVTGTLLVQRDGDTIPAANVEVWAIDGHSHRMKSMSSAPVVGARALSQPVRTDASGSFALHLPRLPDSGEHVFRLQAGGAVGGAAFPTFVTGEEFTVTASTELEPLVLGTVEAPVLVRTLVVDAAHQPIPGARVTLRPVEAPYTFVASALTNGKGEADVTAFPGTWTAVAQPPPNTPYGLCQFDGPVEFGGDDSGDGFSGDGITPELVLVCPRAHRLTGHVLDHRLVASEGVHRFVPVANVSVEAVRRPDEIFADEIHVQVRTGEDGTFDVAVSPGIYDVAFFPTSSSKLPFKHVQMLEVVEGEESSPLVVVLDEPFELFGQLFSGDSSRPVGGTLEAWAVDAGGNALLVGRGIAQLDGSYSILLPGVAR